MLARRECHFTEVFSIFFPGVLPFADWRTVGGTKMSENISLNWELFTTFSFILGCRRECYDWNWPDFQEFRGENVEKC